MPVISLPRPPNSHETFTESGYISRITDTYHGFPCLEPEGLWAQRCGCLCSAVLRVVAGVGAAPASFDAPAGRTFQPGHALFSGRSVDGNPSVGSRRPTTHPACSTSRDPLSPGLVCQCAVAWPSGAQCSQECDPVGTAVPGYLFTGWPNV